MIESVASGAALQAPSPGEALSQNVDPGALQFPAQPEGFDLDRAVSYLQIEARVGAAGDGAKVPPQLNAALSASVQATKFAIALQACVGAAKGGVNFLHRMMQGQ